MSDYIHKKIGVLVLVTLCISLNAFAQIKVNLGASLRYARPNNFTLIPATQILAGVSKNKHHFNIFYMSYIFKPQWGGLGFEYNYAFISKKRFAITVEPEICFWFTPIRYNVVNINVPGDPNFYNKNAISSSVGAGFTYSISQKIGIKAGSKFGWCYSYNRISNIYDNLPKKYSDLSSSFYYHFQIGFVSKF